MLSVWKRFHSFFRPYLGSLAAAIAFMVAVDLVSYAVPFGIGWLTDSVFTRLREPDMLGVLAAGCGALALSGIARGWCSHFMIRNYWRAAEGVVRDLRNALYGKLMHLELSFYDRARTGDLMSRVTSDIQLLRSFIAFGIEHRLRIILITATVFVFLLVQEWRLALVVYAVFPAFFLILIRFSKRMRAAVDARQSQIGALASRLQENLTGIRVVKAFAMEEEEIRRFAAENEALRARETGMSLLQARLNPLLILTNGLATLAIVLYGGYEVITGGMSLGTLLAFVSFLGMMGFPVGMLAYNTSVVNLARGAGERIREILDTPDQKQADTGTATAPFRGRLAFRGVSFAYDPRSPVLTDLTFTIEPGEKVALFGLTGAGKSTLISLIPRFYAPSAGRIEIDGRDITEWELKSLRAQIGIVLQETFLFSASIRDNIAFARPGATLAEVREAARHAEIHDFIESLPDGYDTVVGEYGIGLSGGQKQRVAIARTLLQDPRLLILDDCTSSLDTITERRIQAQLKELMRGRTTILVAQRLAAFALADRIIVLNEGTIQGIDSHERLLETNPLYRETFRAQIVAATAEDAWE
jgi:ABC-type multidrug transport system fused ATPase/permease subunit